MLNYMHLCGGICLKALFLSVLFLISFSLSWSQNGSSNQSQTSPGTSNTQIFAKTVSPYIRTVIQKTRIITNYFYDDEMQVTNEVIYTNTSMSNVPFQWELTQYYKAILTNTNNVSTFITNLNETFVYTNVEIINTNMPYLFRDGFRPLVRVTTAESYEELKDNILDYLLPPYIYHFEESEGRIKRFIRLRNTLFTDEKEFLSFDQEYFDYLLYKEKNKKLQFTAEELKHLAIGFEEWDTKVIIQGTIDLKMGYGLSHKDENNPIALPIQDDFRIEQLMKVNVTGWFGERIKVNIDQDSQREQNKYDIGFLALKKDNNLLRELKVGNISLNIPSSSHYLKYSGTTENSIGIKAVLERNAFSWQTVVNITKTQKAVKTFNGNSQHVLLNIQEIQYVKRRFFVMPDTGIDLGSLYLYRFTTSTNTADRRVDGLYYQKLTEGQDYYVNLSTGEIDLATSLTRDQNLLVTYTHSGSYITTNTNSLVGTDNNTMEKLLYLWRSDMNYSPYVHYGVYNLATTDFDPSRGFSLIVYESEDLSKQSVVQFTPADFELNTIKGFLRFKNILPFPDAENKIYFGPADPTSSDSKNSMKIELYKRVKNYRLDFGVIPGTERVYINGRELNSSEYQIVYALGDLLFTNPALINENDLIEVYYEYQPFFSTSQRFGIASRLDYKPNNQFNIGSTILYGVNQRPSGGAPYIYQTPDGSFMADVDSSINVGKLIGLNDDWNLSVKGEYAISLLDKNTAGYAIIDDFENAGGRFAMSINENRWILAAPTTNVPGITYANRGSLLYKDYRNYNLDNSYTILTYNSILDSFALKPYSEKPGPYLALGGHLNSSEYPQVSQSALIFDYDFSAGSWVGAAINIAGPSGKDFSQYNKLVIWYKVESDDDGDGIFQDTGSQAVELYVGLGQPNEDSDGDGVFDGELDRSQPGYAFNNYLSPTVVDTWVGRGRLGEGDGFVQSEDLNLDNTMQTNDSQVVFPSAFGYTDITNAVLSEGGWNRLSINISGLPDVQRAILEHASAMTIYIKQKSGLKGRVIIDDMQFKELRWEDKRVDGIKIPESDALSGELLGVYDNTFYSIHRFYDATSSIDRELERSILFEKLHGTRTINEALQYNEFTLTLNYQLSNMTVDTNTFPVSGGKKASLIQYSTSPYDISRYKELNFYVYIPSTEENGTDIKQGSDTYTNENFFFVIGNSEQNYYQWSVPLTAMSANAWHKVQIRIDEDLKINIDGTNTSAFQYPAMIGIPNLNDISFIELGVEVNSVNEPYNKGTIWVNEMYVYNDESVFGTAYYINPKFEYKKPVLKSGKTEIMGPVFFNSTFENKSVDFVDSIGGSAGNLNNNINLSFQSSFFKDLKYTVSYTRNLQSTDTNTLELPLYLQWNSANDSFNTTIAFDMKKTFVPVINHTFTEKFYSKLNRSQSLNDTNEYLLSTEDKQYQGTATFNYTHVIPLNRKYSINPNFSIEDNLLVRDYSNFSNESAPVFITNANVFASSSQNKKWGAGLTLILSKFQLSSRYEKRQEVQTLIHDQAGLKAELQEIELLNIGQRYFQRLESIAQGFYFDGDLDKQLEDNVSFSLNVNRPLNWLAFVSTESFSRIQNGYTYDLNNNLTFRNDRYALRNSWNLRLTPEKLPIKTINIKIDRSVDLSYSSVSALIESSNALEMGDIYYRQPFYYSGLIGGVSSQTNALYAVSRFSDGIYGSVNSLSDILTGELTLPRYKKEFYNVFPKRYTFSSRLVTTRNQDSYSQSLENRIGTTIQISMAALIKDKSKVQIRDINADIDYKYSQNLNDRKGTDTVGITFRHGMNFVNSNFLVLNYSYSFRYEFDNYITNSTAHSTLFGFDPDLPNVSPKNSIFNTLSFRATWEKRNIQRLNLLIASIKLKDSAVRHTEGLSFTTQSILYDGSAFNAYDQKLFELILEHITDYKFTEVVTGVFRVKGIMNRFATITPMSSSEDGYTRSLYDVGLGLDLSLDLRIKI